MELYSVMALRIFRELGLEIKIEVKGLRVEYDAQSMASLVWRKWPLPFLLTLNVQVFFEIFEPAQHVA